MIVSICLFLLHELSLTGRLIDNLLYSTADTGTAVSGTEGSGTITEGSGTAVSGTTTKSGSGGGGGGGGNNPRGLPPLPLRECARLP